MPHFPGDEDLHGTIAARPTLKTSGSRTIKARSTGGATNLLEQTQSLNGDGRYSVIAIGGENAISFSVYKEDESDPDSGYAKFRVFNASTFGDNVDVYLTSASADLASESPVFSGIAKQSSAAFRSVATGTYATTPLKASITM